MRTAKTEACFESRRRPRPRHRLLAVLLFVLLCAMGSTGISAQGIHGIVLDSLTGAPLPDVVVVAESSEGRRTALTNRAGRFSILLEGQPPFELSFQRLGYQYITHAMEALSGSPLEIRMEEIAFEMDAIEAEADATDNRFKVFGVHWATNSGLTTPLYPNSCYFPMRDSVVVKDMELVRPEVYRSYERSNLWTGDNERYYREVVSLLREEIFDRRLRRDAWPCGVYKLVEHQALPRVRRIPRPPAPTGTPAALTATRTLPLPTASTCPEAISVSATNHVAYVTRDTSLVHVVDTEANESYSMDPGVPAGSYPCSIRVGWRGGSLWITNGSTGQLNVIDPESSVSAMVGLGVPARMDWALPEHPLPSRPLRMDIPVPVPVAGSRWLWTWPAMDPPSPPIYPDDPPGRQLVLLDEEWELDHVLRQLRPGAGAVDLAFGTEPLIAEQPFGDHPLVQVSPDGASLTVVQREHQMASWMTVYRVTRIDFEGDTIFHRERRAPYIRVDDDDWEAMLERLANSRGALAAMPGESESRIRLLERMVYRAPFHPSISAMMVGHDGTVWLRWPEHEQDEPVQWEVLDGATGNPLYNFEADPALELISANGETVWGVLADENGVRQLVRFTVGVLPNLSR